MKAWLVLLLGSLATAQVLPQDRMRTGMTELGLRAWEVDRRSGSTGMVGISVSRLVTDNVSVGLLAAGLDSGHVDQEFLLDGMFRTYFLPLQSWTPWLEARAGGLVRPLQGSGATHLAAGFGLRWRPEPWMALDLQLVGFERWGYDDPTQYSNGTAEWVLQKAPLRFSLSGDGGWRLVPVPSFQILF